MPVKKNKKNRGSETTRQLQSSEVLLQFFLQIILFFFCCFGLLCDLLKTGDGLLFARPTTPSGCTTLLEE
jgi:hypothetical protein